MAVPVARAALALVLVACSRHSSGAPIAAVEPAPAKVEKEPFEPRLPAWTAATTLRQPPVPLADGVAGIVAHVPEGLDASLPVHLVLFFHGSDQCIVQIAMGGDVVCEPRGRPDVGAGLAWRHDDAGTMSVFAAPQFRLWGGGTAGRMGERGYFRLFVEELLLETFAPGLGGPRTLDDLADITVVAHSAGHIPLAALLDREDLDDKVRNVVLLDALYDGTVEPYLRWLDRGAARGHPRKLVAVYGAWGKNAEVGRAIARHAEGLARGSAVVDPPGALVDAVRTHAVTVKQWPHLEHAWMVLLLTSKTLEGLGFPSRPLSPARVPYGDVPPASGITPGEAREGALDDGDAFLENGALYDDYALDLAAGQEAVVDVRGGRSLTEPCCSLDVTVDVLRDGVTVAHDDDGGGFFDAQLAWTASEAGRYVIRVSTAGAGRRRGPYGVRVRGG